MVTTILKNGGTLIQETTMKKSAIDEVIETCNLLYGSKLYHVSQLN